MKKSKIILSQKLMREPTNFELAEFLEIPIQLIDEAINSSKTIYSLDEPLNDEGKEMTLQDTIGKSDNLDELLMLKDALTNLTPFERELITKRYVNDLTQQQTANELGLTQVQVSRGEQKILTKLKSKLVA